MLAKQLQGAAKSAVPQYIEDVFSTFLYAGNNTSGRVITNDVDLAGKGGLVWFKNRTTAGKDHRLYDSARANDLYLRTNGTDGNLGSGVNQNVTFNSNGFTINSSNDELNGLSTTNYVSWTFRKQAKFFDVVTYTGNGTAGRTVAHNLGSVPGCIIVKRTDGISSWRVYHRTLGGTQYIDLDTTAAAASSSGIWNNTDPTSTQFTLGTNTAVNGNGGTYVAYLFAHDAGGFGAAGTDNVISCGSVSGAPNSTQTVTLGWEPQWILWKPSDDTRSWTIVDNMRGLTADGTGGASLLPNTSDAEGVSNRVAINATGFTMSMLGTPNPTTSIYIAIRRGPMRTPTSGTSVFGLSARTGTGANATVTGGQTDDAVLIKNRGAAVGDLFASRLTGTGYLETSSTAAEVAAGTTILQANPWDVMDGVKVGTTSTITNASANTFINYLFRRAPGFFDVVCYTGTGSGNLTLSHNLTVPPELFITKARNDVDSWQVYWNQQRANLNLNFAFSSDPYTAPTATQFTVLSSSNTAKNHVAYLFATVTGVSKVGSFIGNGTSQTINCGFTNGARFVLVKATSIASNWIVWDSARGIVSGNDPWLALNGTFAELTTTDIIDPDNTGFVINYSSGYSINTNNETYIFLAIA